MRHWILVGLFSLFFGIAALLLVAVGIGELLSGAVPTAVDSLSAAVSTDFPVEPVQIPVNTASADTGPRVHGWLARGARGAGVVLLVHSLRSNRIEMLSRAKFLNEQGYGVLLIDLRAHGETPGDRITFGFGEADDVEASAAWLRNTFPGERVGTIGVSLGAAAIVLAKQPLRFDAVVLESLHSTITEAVENRLRLHLGESGTIFAPLLLWQLSFRFGISPDELNPISRIGDLNAPLLLISGTDDQHTKVAETERLLDAARTPKEIWIVPGGGHFNMHAYAGKEYENRISGFLERYLQKQN